MPRSYDKVYQFHIALKKMKPAIWRRIQVPETYSFWDLHVAIQDAMGWQDYHLHSFRLYDAATRQLVVLGLPDDAFPDNPTRPDWKAKITDYFTFDNPAGEYEYDFGDSWLHVVKLEKILPVESGVGYPRCMEGERACPPEDCGGVPGYRHLVKVISKPKHKEHKEMLSWVGGRYDPAHFDLQAIKFSNPVFRLRRMLGGSELRA